MQNFSWKQAGHEFMSMFFVEQTGPSKPMWILEGQDHN